MTHKMVHLQIIGLKADVLPVIHTLGELGCLHIDRAGEDTGGMIHPLTVDAVLLRRQEELNLQLLQVSGMVDYLRIDPALAGLVEPDSAGLAEQIDQLLPHLQALVNRRDRLRAEQELLPRFEETMRKLLPLFPATASDADYVSFGLLLSREHAEVPGIIQRHAAEITGGRAEVTLGPIDAATQAMLITAPRAFAEAIGAMLDRQDVARLRLPTEFDSTSPDAAIASLRRRLNTVQEECTAVERELEALGRQYGPALAARQNALQDELQTYNILSRLGETEQTFVVQGWTPQADLERLQTTLHERFGERVIVHTLPLTEADRRRAPVALTNPAVARPFEGLVHMYSTPRYDGIDPTRLMALFLPFFFGMMLGDIGYGAVLLGGMLLLRRRFKPGMLRNLTTILAYGAGWSILFGLLFGELFGPLGEELGLHPLLFDRASPAHLIDLLAMTLAVGVVHILLGLLLGLWEGVRGRDRHHLLERGGRLLGLVALLLVVGVLVDLLPEGLMTPALALLVVGTVLLSASLGKIGIVIGPIEMIGLLGNVLSYLRIAAIGLSSVYLARVAGEIAGAVGSVIVGIIIAVLLHVLNLVLGAFSPTIQSLRLHYVEFFRNFYEGGGRAYEPFRYRLATHE